MCCRWAHSRLTITITVTDLAALIGDTFGGAIPDLAGRTPRMPDFAVTGGGGGLGDSGGQEQVFLSEDNLPPHAHTSSLVTGPAVSRAPMWLAVACVQGGAWW